MGTFHTRRWFLSRRSFHGTVASNCFSPSRPTCGTPLFLAIHQHHSLLSHQSLLLPCRHEVPDPSPPVSLGPGDLGCPGGQAAVRVVQRGLRPQQPPGAQRLPQVCPRHRPVYQGGPRDEA